MIKIIENDRMCYFKGEKFIVVVRIKGSLEVCFGGRWKFMDGLKINDLNKNFVNFEISSIFGIGKIIL